jgi:hypothetical protein
MARSRCGGSPDGTSSFLDAATVTIEPAERTFKQSLGANTMKTIFYRQMARIATFLLLLLACTVGNANATVPMKEITIYNDSTTDTIYPVLLATIGQNDLWLQAQFNVVDPITQTFCNNDLAIKACTAPQSEVPRLYKAYINLDKGVRPGEFVSIIVPFYTQLTETDSSTIGKSSGQYIDWWNAERIRFYDGKTAVTGAFNFNYDLTAPMNPPAPPTPVSPIKGAAVPSCAPDNTFNCEPATLVYYDVDFPTGSIPFDFGEYTFAAAEGPPPGGLLPAGSPFTINLSTVNFNVSAVDGVYLPIAIAALGNSTPVQRQYLGTTTSFDTVSATLSTFSNTGKSWPYYWPSYFSKAAPTVAHDTPQDGDAPYRLPKIASANVVFAESYKDPAPSPPVLSSDTNGTPMLGTAAQALVTLWTKCTTTNNMSDTCLKIRDVLKFFSDNYLDTCGLGPPLPPTPTLLTQVYGWAEFPGCSQALVNTPGYDTTISEYCELQYNYLNSATKPEDIFNPYAKLVHQTLATNAYAFSIDDKFAFKSVPGDGLIITIGGPKGLAFPTEQAPLPTTANIHKYCR